MSDLMPLGVLYDEIAEISLTGDASNPLLPQIYGDIRVHKAFQSKHRNADGRYSRTRWEKCQQARMRQVASLCRQAGYR